MEIKNNYSRLLTSILLSIYSKMMISYFLVFIVAILTVSAQNQNFTLRVYGGTPQNIGSGSYNCSFGLNALNGTMTGSYNLAIGNNALFSITRGEGNLACGWSTLKLSTSAFYNTAIGHSALINNTTGSYNTASGAGALNDNVNGNDNTAFGVSALSINRSGSFNTAIGENALYTNSTGINNTAIGYKALYSNSIGNTITAVGCFADIINPNLNLTNSTAIGNGARVNANNKVVIGNTAVSVIGGQVNWSVLSDKRYKQNIKSVNNGLAFIIGLKPVSYQYDNMKVVKEQLQNQMNIALARSKDGSDENLQTQEQKRQEEYEKYYQEELKNAEQSSLKRFYGLIAQDVDEAAKKTGYSDFSGIVQPEENGGHYALRYAEFVVPLISAVQEQQEAIINLKKENQEKQNQLDALQSKLRHLEELVNKIAETSQAIKTTKVVLNAATIDQNIPNPFKNITKIPYYIPENSRSAQIVIYNSIGGIIKEFPIKSFGKDELILQINDFTTGTYHYSLFIDGIRIDTKKMLLTQ